MPVFIDKKRYFGKKEDDVSIGVAPKHGGSVVGKWVWHRERSGKLSPQEEHEKDVREFSQADEQQKKQQLFLLKTAKGTMTPQKETAVMNLKNRLEVLNSELLNFFLGEGSAVKNTITYSTYSHEKLSEDKQKTFFLEEKLNLRGNGFVKEELASLYVGDFDSKGYDTDGYNLSMMQQSNFQEFRAGFAAFALMNFADLLHHFDNCAYVGGKLVITDTGIGSGNTGAHTMQLLPGQFSADFDHNVLKSFDELLSRREQSHNLALFYDKLTVADVISGIENLEKVDRSGLAGIFQDCFSTYDCPFPPYDERSTAFSDYANKMDAHGRALADVYSARIEALKQFKYVLQDFYPHDSTQYHVPSASELMRVGNMLLRDGVSQHYYDIYREVNEAKYQLSQNPGQDKKLEDILDKIIAEYKSNPTNPILNYNEIENLFKQAQQMVLDSSEALKADLSQHMPTEKWKRIFETPEAPDTRSKSISMSNLSKEFKQFEQSISSGRLMTKAQMLDSLTPKLREAYAESVKLQEQGIKGKARGALSKMGLLGSHKGSKVAKGIGEFMEEKSFQMKK